MMPSHCRKNESNSPLTPTQASPDNSTVISSLMSLPEDNSTSFDMIMNLPEDEPSLGSPSCQLSNMFTQSESDIGLVLSDDDDETDHVEEDLSRSMSKLCTNVKRVRFNLPSARVPTRRSLSAGSTSTRRPRRRRAPVRNNSDDRWESSLRLQRTATRPPPSSFSPAMPVRRKSLDKEKHVDDESNKTTKNAIMTKRNTSSPLTIPVRRRSADKQEKVSPKPLQRPTRRQSIEDLSTADLLKFALAELHSSKDLGKEDRDFLEGIEDDPAVGDLDPVQVH